MTHRTPLRAALSLAAMAGLIALAGVASGEKIPPDPVDEFVRALQREKSGSAEARLDVKDNKARDYALAFRRRELERAAANLTTLGELVRVLLLIWPTEESPGFEAEARLIDDEVRRELLQRFEREARRALRRGSPSRQAAVALLIGEAASSSARYAELSLFRKIDIKAVRASRETLVAALDRLAPDVAALTASPDASVRGAVARALGQLPRRPYTAARGLDRILATDKSVVANRRAAGAALGLLVQASTKTELLKASEPGIAQRDARGSLDSTKESIAVWAAVIPVAARGLSDPDVRVRRECAVALEQATGAMAREMSVAAGYVLERDIKLYPPRGRKQLSKEERQAIEEGLEEIEKFEEEIRPAIAAMTVSKVNGCTVGEMLVNAAADPDALVRLGVRRTFEEIARAHRNIRNLRDLLPRLEEEKKKPEKDKDDEEKLPLPKDEKKDKDGKGKDKKDEEIDITRGHDGAPVVLASARTAKPQPEAKRAAPPPLEVRAEADDKAEKLDAPEKNGRKGKMAEPDEKEENEKEKEEEPEDKGKDEDPFAKVKVHPDALGRLLRNMVREVVNRGTSDTNAAGRRASLEGIEAMGDAGAEFIPQLIKALRDPDRFVRWIAARVLGKLAPNCARDVVPALVVLLGELDLDVRVAAIDALGLYNSSSAGAVPALAAHLGKGDAESRSAILRALEHIGTPAVPALPAVRQLLTATDPRLRAEAARLIGLLGRLGRCGEEYLPDLRRLLRDPDSGVRAEATAAILRLTER